MIFILHGQDDFSISKRLVSIKRAFTPQSVLRFNFTEYNVASLDPSSALLTISTPPFLASRRIVVFKDLMTTLAVRSNGSGSGRVKQSDSHSLSRGRTSAGKNLTGQVWEDFKITLKQPPHTTDIIFVESNLISASTIANLTPPTANIEEFKKTVRYTDVRNWIIKTFKSLSCPVTPKAVDELYRLCGSNLWVLDNEIKKLTLYSQGKTVTDSDVSNLVSDYFDATIFQVIDAIVEKKALIAFRLLYSLMSDKNNLSTTITMLARQLRLIILTIFLLNSGVKPYEIGEHIGIKHSFIARRLLTQSRHFSQPQAEAMLKSLFNIEFAIKTGKVEQRSALEVIIATLMNV